MEGLARTQRTSGSDDADDRNRATTRRCSSSCRRSTTTGDIELSTYEGLYCVSCEAYYSEDELVDGNLPDPRHAGRARRRAELLLQVVASTTACSRSTRRIPMRCNPNRGGTRCSGSSAAACRTSDEPYVDRLGRPAPVGSRARRVRLGRRALQLLHRGRLRQRRGAVREVVAGRLPPRRQGHLAVPRGDWPAMLMAVGLNRPGACSRTAGCSSAARR